MKTIFFIFITFIAINTIDANDSFYYTAGDSVWLYPADNKIVIGFKDNYIGDMSDIFLDYEALNDTIQPIEFDSVFFVFELNPETNVNELINNLKQDSRVLMAQYVYLNSDGGEVVFWQQNNN